jgi:hypothetical protein
MSRNQDQSHTPASHNRRKMLAGLLGVSTVVALAPQQWTQPALKRVIVPAHGQAFSIAAGVYTFGFEEVYAEGSSLFYSEITAQISWPGGVGRFWSMWKLLTLILVLVA